MINKIKILAVGLITATAFSITNAGQITLTSNNGENMDQTSITVIDTSITLTENNILDFQCDADVNEGMSCYLQISPYCMIRGDENGIDLVSDCYFTAGEYNIVSPCIDNSCFAFIEIEHDGLLEDLQNPGDDNNNTQGGVGGDNEETQNGSILQQGTATFTPIINRIIEIAGEFIPYAIYIFIGYLGISLMWRAVKVIIKYLEKKNKMAFYTYEDRVSPTKNGFQIQRVRKRRKKIKRKYFRNFR